MTAFLAKRRLRLITAVLVSVLFASPARSNAHQGPPYPLIVDQLIGPCLVSVWGDPDVGIGTFFIILEPGQNDELPDDVIVELAVRPASERLSEVVYGAQRENVSGRVQYKAEIPFDAEELWRVRLILNTSNSSGEAVIDVEVTPPGFGRWDVLLYLLPFLAVGVLWLRAFLSARGQAHQAQTNRD